MITVGVLEVIKVGSRPCCISVAGSIPIVELWVNTRRLKYELSRVVVLLFS